MGPALRNQWESTRASYWFIPSIMVVAAILLSFLTEELDQRFQFEIATTWPGMFLGGPDGARAVLSTVAGSMITVAGVTFSITIAALSNASSAYGPRLLRTFMRDTGSQVVLGTFVATFIYCLLVLRRTSGTEALTLVPHVSVTIGLGMALASIGVLIYFIHHISRMIQITNVVARVGLELLEEIEHLFPREIGTRSIQTGVDDSIKLDNPAVTVMPDSNQRSISIAETGYVQAIDVNRLLEAARANDVVIRIVEKPGAFVTAGTPLAIIWPADRVDAALQHELSESFVLGMGRTPYQDLELYFYELTEIAMRALSPAMNDPLTGITCIDWISAGLSALATSRLPSRYRYDVTGSLRVIADPPSFEAITNAVYGWIRNSAHNYPGVMQKLIEMAIVIAPNANSERERTVLLENVRLVDEVCQALPYQEHEKRNLRDCYRRAVEVLTTYEDETEVGEPITTESLRSHP